MDCPSLPSTPFHSETAQCFPGLQERFQELGNQSFAFPDEVMDDLDDEQEGTNAVDGDTERNKSLDIKDLAKEDVQMFDGTTSSSQPMAPSSSNLIDMDSSGLCNVLKDASKGVSEGT